jgi:hypothetical protein
MCRLECGYEQIPSEVVFNVDCQTVYLFWSCATVLLIIAIFSQIQPGHKYHPYSISFYYFFVPANLATFMVLGANPFLTIFGQLIYFQGLAFQPCTKAK